MKFILVVGLVFCSLIVKADTVLTCASSDFNPANYDGQALKIHLDSSGMVQSVRKLKGSWFCDEKTISKLPVIGETKEHTVYEANFNCDEYNGRLIVPKEEKPTWAVYSFSYPDDERNRNARYNLVCR